MNIRQRALLAATVGAAVVLAPASAMAVKPVKPPPCAVSPGVTVQTVKVKGVTTIYVTGTPGPDLIDCQNATSRVVAHGGGSGSGTLADSIYGGSKNDDLYGESTGAGQVDYVVGYGGNDTIHVGGGSATGIAIGDDFLVTVPGGGADTLIATGGFVQFYGRDGNDQIDVSAATGSLVEGEGGNDTILGSPGHDSLYGGAGDDTLTDSAGNTEIFDCGDGANDVLNDLDGNGTGGWSGDAEDDSHVACETVNYDSTPACAFTPGTTGCIVLSNVAITDNPSTATYLISGTVTFTPTCNPLVPPCDYAYPNVLFTGSGTFSVTGSQTASGTWTIPAQPNDRPDASAPYSFTDADGTLTTCSAAVIRMVEFTLPLVASGGATGGSWLEVRTDDVGTSDVVGGIFSTGPLPTGTFRNPADSQAGVTILC